MHFWSTAYTDMTQPLIKHKGKVPLRHRHESAIYIIDYCSDTSLGFGLKMFSSISLAPQTTKLYAILDTDVSLNHCAVTHSRFLDLLRKTTEEWA